MKGCGGVVEVMSTRGFGFCKIHTSLLYLTGNYMEMWHNGEQASGVTTALAGEEGNASDIMTLEPAYIPPSSQPTRPKQCWHMYMYGSVRVGGTSAC